MKQRTMKDYLAYILLSLAVMSSCAENPQQSSSDLVIVNITVIDAENAPPKWVQYIDQGQPDR